MKKIFLFILVFSFTYSCCDCPTSGENNSSSTENDFENIECKHCDGSGTVIKEVLCNLCHGDGYVEGEPCWGICTDGYIRELVDCEYCHGK
jgi:hypothetical protein